MGTKTLSKMKSRGLRSLLVGFLMLTLCPKLSTLHAQTSQLIVGNLHGLRDVRAYPGSNLGEKLAACLADSPSYLLQTYWNWPTGSICDARGLEGPQEILKNPFSSLPSVLGQYSNVTVLFGNATITTVPLDIPNTGGLVIRGMGPFVTTFIASQPNSPIFRGPSSSNTICDDCYLGGFAVKANPGGSGGPAIETSGFRFSTFEDIAYLSNGAANFGSFFHFAATPAFDYNNRVIHPIVEVQTGPQTVFLFDNGGSGNPILNAQNHFIYDVAIYLNTGITTVFDVRRSAHVVIRGGVVEANGDVTVLIPGAGTIMEDIWMENPSANPIVPASSADGSSNGVVLRDNYFAIPFTLVIPSWASGWVISGNWPRGNLKLVDNGTGNFVQ